MNVALTGAAGHLGAAAMQELCRRNISVNVLVREDTKACNGLPVNIIKGDLLNTGVLHKLLQGCDAVIHCAAVISVNGDPTGMVHRTNVEGTKLVVENALEAGIKRFIHISSINAYQQQPSFIVLEETGKQTDENGHAYDRSKQAGQEIALLANSKKMEVLVMNPTSIIGPYDFKPSRMGQVIMDLYNGKLPFIFNGGTDFCDSRDLASAIVNGLTMGRPGESYLLSGKWYSLLQMAETLSTVSAKKIKLITLPAIAAYTGLPFVKLLAVLQKKEPLYSAEALDALFKGNRFICSDKARKELNYTTRPFEETISDTFQWFRNNRYL